MGWEIGKTAWNMVVGKNSEVNLQGSLESNDTKMEMAVLDRFFATRRPEVSQ